MSGSANQSRNSISVDCEIILLAEDNEDHVFFIRRAFRQAGLLNPLHVVNDGEQAIAYLTGEGKYANREEYPLPCLLLLDLKMPNKNGFQVLEWLRHQPSLAALRVVVLTTSGETKDITRLPAWREFLSHQTGGFSRLCATHCRHPGLLALA